VEPHNAAGHLHFAARNVSATKIEELRNDVVRLFKALREFSSDVDHLLTGMARFF
jgi:hypothetical protein